MVSYVPHTRQVPFYGPPSPRHVSFMPIPIYSRQPHDDELYVMRAFEKHACHCSYCANPLASHLSGSTLCAKGHARAIDVAQYVYSKDGKAYSLVDRKEHQRVRLEVPATLLSLKSLLAAWEQGMSLMQPNKRERAVDSTRRERTEKVRPPRLDTATHRPSTAQHRRTGSNSSSDYDYIYTWDDSYNHSPASFYPASPSAYPSPRRTAPPMLYRVSPGSPTAEPIYYRR